MALQTDWYGYFQSSTTGSHLGKTFESCVEIIIYILCPLESVNTIQTNPTQMKERVALISLFLLLIFSSIEGNYKNIPSDWVKAIKEGNMLYSPADPSQSVQNNYNKIFHLLRSICFPLSPTGMWAPQYSTIQFTLQESLMKIRKLLCTGVYNGRSTTDPSHRARIPGSINI